MFLRELGSSMNGSLFRISTNSERQHQQQRYENWVALNASAKQAAASLPLQKPPVLEINDIRPPEDVTDEDDLINDVTLDLSHATIEAEAVEFEEAVAMERLPHADMGGMVDSGGGGMNGAGTVREQRFLISLILSRLTR
jgi:hypothetical protein